MALVPVKSRPIVLKDEDQTQFFAWTGPAATMTEAKIAAADHEMAAWRAITAATGRRGEMPATTPSLKFMKRRDSATETHWKCGRGMLAALQALPTDRTVDPALAMLAPKMNRFAESLIFTDRQLAKGRRPGGHVWAIATLTGSGDLTSRKMSMSIGAMASGSDTAMAEADTITAILSLMACAAATGTRPLVRVMHQCEASATLRASKTRDAKARALDDIPQIAAALEAMGSHALAKRIIGRIDDLPPPAPGGT